MLWANGCTGGELLDITLIHPLYVCPTPPFAPQLDSTPSLSNNACSVLVLYIPVVSCGIETVLRTTTMPSSWHIMSPTWASSIRQHSSSPLLQVRGTRLSRPTLVVSIALMLYWLKVLVHPSSWQCFNVRAFSACSPVPAVPAVLLVADATSATRITAPQAPTTAASWAGLHRGVSSAAAGRRVPQPLGHQRVSSTQAAANRDPGAAGACAAAARAAVGLVVAALLLQWMLT